MKIICHDWSTALDIVNRCVHEPPRALYVEMEGKRIIPSGRGLDKSQPQGTQRTTTGTRRYVITDERTGDYVTLIKHADHLVQCTPRN